MRSIFWVSLVLTFVASKRSRIFWSGSWSTIEPKTLATGLRLCDDWDLSIDLKLFMRPSNRNREKNIFGLKVKGKTDLFPGSRLPSLFIKQGLNYIRLYASLITSSSESLVYGKQGNALATGKWHNLKLSQIDGLYVMKVNNKIVNLRSNTESQTWNNVELVMGDTYGKPNYASAVGEYRKFEIKSCQKKSTTQFKIPFNTIQFSTTTKSTTSTTTTKSTTSTTTTISTTDLTTIQTTTTFALTTQMTSKITTSKRVFIANQSSTLQRIPISLHVFIFCNAANVFYFLFAAK